MAKNIALTTIGVKVSYATEQTAGTRPITGYKVIHGLYSTPDFNVAPNTADATSFDNKEYTSKVTLLKEMPDNIEFGARFGQVFADEWKAAVSAEAALADGKEMWFCIDIPDYDQSIFFTGRPLALGIPAMEANNGIDISAYVAPTGEPVFDSDPAYASET